MPVFPCRCSLFAVRSSRFAARSLAATLLVTLDASASVPSTTSAPDQGGGAHTPEHITVHSSNRTYRRILLPSQSSFSLPLSIPIASLTSSPPRAAMLRTVVSALLLLTLCALGSGFTILFSSNPVTNRSPTCVLSMDPWDCMFREVPPGGEDHSVSCRNTDLVCNDSTTYYWTADGNPQPGMPCIIVCGPTLCGMQCSTSTGAIMEFNATPAQ